MTVPQAAIDAAQRVERIGDAVLLLGDCLAILPHLGPVDAVVTDPPYKLSQEYGSGADADNLVAVSAIWPVSAMLHAITTPGGLCAVFYDTRILPLALDAMRHNGWKYLRNLTLYRRWGNASVVHGWMSTSDFVLLFGKGGERHSYHGQVFHDVYVKDTAEVTNSNHPAQKPQELVRQIVARIMAEGGTCLDPWMGSGTTGVACAKLRQRFIGIEIEPKYFDTACRRIEAAYDEPDMFAPRPAPAVQEPLFPKEAAE